MRPTLGQWLKCEDLLSKSEAVSVWMDRPLPNLKHRAPLCQPGEAFAAFRDDAARPDNTKEILWVSDKQGPGFEAQLVFKDLPKVTREWSLAFHQESIQELALCGVTGTNGKSSVVHFLAQLLSASKIGPAAKLGTLGLETQMGLTPSPNTTPFPLDLHPFMERSRKDGHRVLVMEASSHALDQGRLDGLTFKAVGFTNLTQDHLDYHKDMPSLFEAKAKLLELCGGCAVYNLDCEWMSRHHHFANSISYSTKNDQADLYAKVLKRLDVGFEMELCVFGQKRTLLLPLLGEFNVSNILCALGMALAMDGNGLKAYLSVLENIKAPKGRLEKIACRAEGRVIVDYAHTPDALESVLSTMKHHVEEGKLKVLFGCGGDRDAGKRPLMGEIAAKYADAIYLTSDNPRFEEPEKILEDIEVGLRKTEKAYEKIVSREEAILKALSELRPDELLMLCGKGHEDYQDVKGVKTRMDEGEVCQTY